jgi:radical SAM superfamily enzyme YgiQ (UPF0313 family)
MAQNNGKLKIYLGDITHDTIVLVSDTIPINIGFIASYMKKTFGEKIDISLFKYPNEIINAIKSNPPDMIALSNYSWNSNLAEFIASFAKKYNSNVVTTQGGTNFPHDELSQKKFLSQKPATDIFTFLEGEKSCSNIVQRILESNKDREKIFNKAIDGCLFIHPDTKNSNNQIFLKGKVLDRIRNLDEIPSPYLTGILDKFFDGKLTPFIETNRGCPFKCSFCHTGADYFHKLNKFSEERVKNEIEYIGKRAGALGITNLHLADVNFGMYPQDKKTCEMLAEVKEKYGWPLQIMGSTGKNSKNRILEITRILGDMFDISMAMQSMDEQVLSNVERSNIKLDHMIEFNSQSRREGRTSACELILPLPGETKETFIKGLDNVINSNVSRISVYTLMMLHGTDFKIPNYREKYNYTAKFRIVPLNFGQYEGQKIFDYEEAGVATKDLSFDDYLYLRSIALLVESLHNGKPFDEFFKYAKLYNIQPASLLKILFDNISTAPKDIQKIMNEFITETKNELWDTEEDLLTFYRKDENYAKLKKGEVGGNLIYKYKSKNLVEAGLSWIDFMKNQVFDTVKQKLKDTVSTELIKSEISEIANFCRLKINALLNVSVNTGPVENEFQFDVLKWLDEVNVDKNNSKKRLSDYKFPDSSKKIIVFEFTKEQIRMREDAFQRYGTDINAISKIVTRISNLESQFRKVRYNNEKYLRDIYKKMGDSFVRYALSR